jgi:hypothetical protein
VSPREPLSGDVSAPGEAPPPPPRARGRRFSVAGATRAGVGMGSALAITISWSVHQSILWAIVHGFLSWVYVAYYALTR